MLKDFLQLISLSKQTRSTSCLQLLNIFISDPEKGIKNMSMGREEGMRRRGLRRQAQFEIIRAMKNWRKKLEMIIGLQKVLCEGNLNKEG